MIKIFYLLLVVTLPFVITAFPQNSGEVSAQSNTTSQVDGFIFDGPVATRPPNEQQKSTSTSTTTSTTTTSTTTPLPEEFNACITNCPVTNEYNPVCGTDNVDYTNPGGLGCAQTCGKEVILNYYGRCSTGTSG